MIFFNHWVQSKAFSGWYFYLQSLQTNHIPNHFHHLLTLWFSKTLWLKLVRACPQWSLCLVCTPHFYQMFARGSGRPIVYWIVLVAGVRFLGFAHGGSGGAKLVNLPRLLYERGAILLTLLPQRWGGPLVAGTVGKRGHLEQEKELKLVSTLLSHIPCLTLLSEFSSMILYPEV